MLIGVGTTTILFMAVQGFSFFKGFEKTRGKKEEFLPFFPPAPIRPKERVFDEENKRFTEESVFIILPTPYR